MTRKIWLLYKKGILLKAFQNNSWTSSDLIRLEGYDIPTFAEFFSYFIVYVLLEFQ